MSPTGVPGPPTRSAGSVPQFWIHSERHPPTLRNGKRSGSRRPHLKRGDRSSQGLHHPPLTDDPPSADCDSPVGIRAAGAGTISPASSCPSCPVSLPMHTRPESLRAEPDDPEGPQAASSRAIDGRGSPAHRDDPVHLVDDLVSTFACRAIVGRPSRPGLSLGQGARHSCPFLPRTTGRPVHVEGFTDDERQDDRMQEGADGFHDLGKRGRRIR